MLSIRFDTTHEWWVSGKTFDRLFESALQHGDLPGSMEDFKHVANANGGLDLSLLDQDDASRLVEGLKQAAQRQLDEVDGLDPATENGAYVIAVRECLSLAKSWRHASG